MIIIGAISGPILVSLGDATGLVILHLPRQEYLTIKTSVEYHGCREFRRHFYSEGVYRTHFVIESEVQTRLWYALNKFKKHNLPTKFRMDPEASVHQRAHIGVTHIGVRLLIF